MDAEKERFFTITDNKGVVIEYEILFTFESSDTNKTYVIFTDNKLDKTDAIMTYAATYKKSGNKLELGSIETEKEWSLIENLLSQFEEKMND